MSLFSEISVRNLGRGVLETSDGGQTRFAPSDTAISEENIRPIEVTVQIQAMPDFKSQTSTIKRTEKQTNK
jgi:hypothetical protein